VGFGSKIQLLFRKLLVGFDDSPQSKKAVDVAMDLAECMDAKLLAFSVIWLPKPATRVEVRATLDDETERYSAALEMLVGNAKERGLDMKTEIAVGQPADQIIHRTGIGDIDMVILGHRSTSRFAKLVKGSTSERVLKYVPCPVMIVG
jgi:nucleotide-binding universal stress UspA family protein